VIKIISKHLFIILSYFLTLLLLNCGTNSIESNTYLGNDTARAYNIVCLSLKDRADSASLISTLNFSGNDGSVSFSTGAGNSSRFETHIPENGTYVFSSNEYINLYSAGRLFIGSERDNALFISGKYKEPDTFPFFLAGTVSGKLASNNIGSENYYVTEITLCDTPHSKLGKLTFTDTVFEYSDSTTYKSSFTAKSSGCTCTFENNLYINVSSSGEIISTANISDSLLSSGDSAEYFGYISSDTDFFVLAKTFSDTAKDSPPKIMLGLRYDTDNIDTVISANLDFAAFTVTGNNYRSAFGTFFISSDSAMTVRYFQNDTSAELYDSGYYIINTVSDTGNFIYSSYSGSSFLNGETIEGYINTGKTKLIFANIRSSTAVMGIALKEK